MKTPDPIHGCGSIGCAVILLAIIIAIVIHACGCTTCKAQNDKNESMEKANGKANLVIVVKSSHVPNIESGTMFVWDETQKAFINDSCKGMNKIIPINVKPTKTNDRTVAYKSSINGTNVFSSVYGPVLYLHTANQYRQILVMLDERYIDDCELSATKNQ